MMLEKREIVAYVHQCVRGTSLKDIAMLLYELPGGVEFFALRQKLAERLTMLLNASTVKTAPLAEVAMAVCVAHSLQFIELTGQQIAWFVQRLLSSEVRPGGPYRDTTHTSPCFVDNAWIYGALHGLGVSVENLNIFLQKLVDNQTTKHLLETEVGCMAITVLPPDIRARLLRRLSDSIARVTTYGELEAVQVRLLRRHGFTVDRRMSQKSGLSPLGDLRLSRLHDTRRERHTLDAQKDALYGRVGRYIAGQPFSLRPLLQQLHSAVRNRDVAGEIALFPFMTVQSFARAHPFRAAQLADLGAANICCWMAYTVYDDFLDNEGDPLLISAANSAHRASLLFARQALGDDAKYRKYFDAMDSANTWEQQQARFSINNGTILLKELPAYGSMAVIADRAGGHIAGACLVARHFLTGREYAAYEQALRHYLIAKQLNDDLHDWRQDICAGRITPVVAMIIGDAGMSRGEYALDAATSQLEGVFYRKTFRRVIHTMRLECQAAMALLQTIESYVPRAGIGLRIDTVLRSCQESQRIQQVESEFAGEFTRT